MRELANRFGDKSENLATQFLEQEDSISIWSVKL